MKLPGGLLLACASAALLIADGAVAAQPAAPQAAKDAGTTEEIVVQAQPLYEIREAMVAAEDRFYARYNELNRRDEFDIVCHLRKQTGTFSEERRCYPRAVDRATEDEGRALLETLSYVPPKDGNSASGVAPPPVSGGRADLFMRPRAEDPHLALARQADDYKKNLLQLLRENPELRTLAKDREDLGTRYESERKRRLNGKMARFEWSDHP